MPRELCRGIFYTKSKRYFLEINTNIPFLYFTIQITKQFGGYILVYKEKENCYETETQTCSRFVYGGSSCYMYELSNHGKSAARNSGYGFVFGCYYSYCCEQKILQGDDKEIQG